MLHLALICSFFTIRDSHLRMCVKLDIRDGTLIPRVSSFQVIICIVTICERLLG